MDDPAASSTIAEIVPDPDTGAAGVWFRRAFIALLAVIVLAALLHLLGVRSRTVSAASADGGTTVDVHYAQVARAGLDVPFRVTVHRSGGFDGDITLAVASDYLDLFDRSTIEPEPSASTATEDQVIWQFSPPPGEDLQVSVDMQVQGGRHWGRDGSVELLDDAGGTVVTVTFKTWLAP